MSQLTIYLDEDAGAAVKMASASTPMSVRKWLAPFAETEKAQLTSNCTYFWAAIDRLHRPQDDQALVFLLDPIQRDINLAADSRLESTNNTMAGHSPSRSAACGFTAPRPAHHRL